MNNPPDVHGVAAVLACGVDVAADVEAVLGDVVAGQAAGDLLLGFQGADAAFADYPTARSVANRKIMSSWSRNRRARRSPSLAIWVRSCWLSAMPLATAPRYQERMP